LLGFLTLKLHIRLHQHVGQCALRLDICRIEPYGISQKPACVLSLAMLPKRETLRTAHKIRRPLPLFSGLLCRSARALGRIGQQQPLQSFED
jgi:hypothetical protein